jgi:hypothetical protein
MVDRIAGQRAIPDPQQPSLAPGAAPSHGLRLPPMHADPTHGPRMQQ